MKVFKSGLLLCIFGAILVSQNLNSSVVVIVNNSEKEVVLKRTETGKDKFRQEIKIGNLWLLDNVNFDDDTGNILISGPTKKLFGGNDYEKFRLKIRKEFEIKKGCKFGDYIILLDKSKDGELSAQINLITPKLIEILKKDFSPVVLKLNEIVDFGVGSLDEDGVKKALEVIEEFYEIYRNNVCQYNIIKEIYREFMVKISAFKDECGSNRLSNLMVSQLSFGGAKITTDNKLNSLKIIEEIINSGSEDLELELVRKFWQTKQNLLQEIEVFAKSIIINPKYEASKNIISKIIIACGYFKSISDQDREATKNDLVKIITKKFPALIANFEEIINLTDKEISSLDKGSLDSLVQKFEEFGQRYNGIAGNYSIINEFYREELDKIVVLANKFKEAFDKIDSVKYKTVQMSVEDIRLYSGVIDKLGSLNKESFEVDLIKFFAEQKFEFLNKLGEFVKFLSEDTNCSHNKNLLEKIDSARLLFSALEKKDDKLQAKHELIEIVQSILNPAIIKLNKIVNLKRKDIAVLGVQDLEKWYKKISKFKDSYKDSLKKYSIIEDFYKKDFDCISKVGEFFEQALNEINCKKNESELKSYKKLNMSDENKRECKKVISKICSVKENFELELVKFLGLQKFDFLKKVQDFSRFVSLKETNDNHKNIINKIILMSDFFTVIKDEKRVSVAKELEDKIEAVFVSNYLKLKKIIVLRSDEVNSLEEQALRSAKKKIAEFSHEFELTVKKYEILGFLFKDLKDKIDSIGCEILKALDKIEVSSIDCDGMSPEDKLRSFVFIKKIINKIDLGAVEKELESVNKESRKNIKILALVMAKKEKDFSQKNKIEKIAFLIRDNTEVKVEIKKTRDGFKSNFDKTESMYINGYGSYDL